MNHFIMAHRVSGSLYVSEEVGFEPTNPCGFPVFKTGAIGHSATLPEKDTRNYSTYEIIFASAIENRQEI